MSFLKTDTIAALATAPLAAGVAVVRLSGPQALAAAQRVANFLPERDKISPRHLYFGPFRAPDGEKLDEGLAVYFTAPASFTGEDVVELHGHGGRAVVADLLNALYSSGEARPAEAGEFTRRAFENGKLDLTAAEGLADLIAAETSEQKRQALRQMDGELARFFEEVRGRLMHLLAHVEAAIDFPDEELDVLKEAGLREGLNDLKNTLKAALHTRAGERLREGFRLAVIGPPNAGKSTLTNLLTGRETAIVSPIAGTTRDVVEAHLDIGGFPVILADTAGIRDTEDVLEREGVARARAQARTADLVLLVSPAETSLEDVKNFETALPAGRSLLVISKTDLSPLEIPENLAVGEEKLPILGLNLTRPESLESLLAALQSLIETHFSRRGEAARLTRERHRRAVEEALKHLERALALYENPTAKASLCDLLAQDLRDAARAIGSVTGKTGSEDVLDLVFSTFCIGK